jgi:hypothetical protein
MNSTTSYLEAWQHVWHRGIAPQLTTEGLQGLKAALVRNDPRLITGATTNPPPLQCVADWPVESCCPLSFALLDGLAPSDVSVSLLEQEFATACNRADQLLGEPAGVRHFLNWVDETPREDMRGHLLAEVEQELAEREAGKEPPPCSCCGSVNNTGKIPDVDDAEGWRQLAMDHELGCLWILHKGRQPAAAA